MPEKVIEDGKMSKDENHNTNIKRDLITLRTRQ
jgi:hypothetical protein